MPTISGYFRASYDSYGPSVAFTVPGWTGAYYPKNGVVFSDAKGGGFFFYTDVNSVHYEKRLDPPFRPKDGEVYSFKLVWDNVAGQATVYINGTARGTLPAPTLSEAEQPLQIFQPGYYPNWWDVPEYQTQAAATGIGAALSGVAGYVLKPIDPVISALIGAGLGGGAGYGLAYLATTGIPEIPIPALGAAPEGPEAPARLGKYQITG